MVLKLCILLIVVLFAFSLIVLYVKSRRIPFARVKHFLLRKRKINVWVFALLFVFAIAVFVGFNMNRNDEKQAVITLNYTDASKGQNANGTRFDMEEIISTEVIQRAIEKGGFEDVTVKDLKKCLSVYPTVQGNSYSEDGYHISTEFTVQYTASRRTKKLDAKNVVQMIGAAYKEFYIDKYGDDFSALDFKLEDMSAVNESDYPDIIEYLQDQAAVISNYMYSLAEKNRGFTSSDGETFNSLAGKIANLNDEQIEKNLKALVYQNGISKDSAAYIKRLGYKNTLLDYDAQRAGSSYDTRNAAVAMYAEQMTRIVLVPTRDSNDEFYMGRTKVGIDDLSTEAQSYSAQAEDLNKQIETNKAFITALRKSSYRSGNNAEVDSMILGIEEVLEKYAARAARIGQEYSETRINDCVSVSVTDDTFTAKAVTLVVLVALFFLALRFFGVAREMLESDDVNIFFADSRKETK